MGNVELKLPALCALGALCLCGCRLFFEYKYSCEELRTQKSIADSSHDMQVKGFGIDNGDDCDD